MAMIFYKHRNQSYIYFLTSSYRIMEGKLKLLDRRCAGMQRDVGLVYRFFIPSSLFYPKLGAKPTRISEIR
jgi:hypothetical protein